MNLKIDEDVKLVLENMQRNIPANRLMGVANVIPKMAQLLWARYPAEHVFGFTLETSIGESRPSATESHLE